MRVKFEDNYELSKFVKKCLFGGDKDCTFSDFENIQICVMFKEIEFDTNLDEFEVAKLMRDNGVKFLWTCSE